MALLLIAVLIFGWGLFFLAGQILGSLLHSLYVIYVVVPWRSPWTYAVLSVILLLGGSIPGMFLCIVACLLAHHFSPGQIERREWTRREQIRAETWAQKEYECERQREARQQQRQRRDYAQARRRKQARALLYQNILALKARINNIQADMSNLYAIMKCGRFNRSERNKIANQIADLKAEKLRLASEMNQLYLDMHQYDDPDHGSRKRLPKRR